MQPSIGKTVFRTADLAALKNFVVANNEFLKLETLIVRFNISDAIFEGNLMRTLIVFFLLTTIAIAQEGIPAKVGNGSLPPGLKGETDLNAIKRRRVEALQLAVEDLRNRSADGSIEINFLLAAQIELAIANLESTSVKKERLAHIENALINSLLTWQIAEAKLKVGVGSIADETKARAAVFKYRAMWLAEKAEGSQQVLNAQEGIPANVGNGSLPPGLEGETDLNAIKRRRIEALKHAVATLQYRHAEGLIKINFLLAAQIELAIANLESTSVKKERLAHIETALINSLLTWQMAEEALKVGMGSVADETKARAVVFKYLAMWLAEKAEDSQQVLNAQEGIPANVGNGSLPPGLEGETDLSAIKQRRVEALELALEALRNRSADGSIEINFLLEAQIELAIANLESTSVKKERLAHIENALINLLLTWQMAEAELKVSMGSVADETKARAAVFKYRAMWLAEKAEGSQQVLNAQEGIPANVGNGSLPPGLEGETDLNAIKQRALKHCNLPWKIYGIDTHKVPSKSTFSPCLKIARYKNVATRKRHKIRTRL